MSKLKYSSNTKGLCLTIIKYNILLKDTREPLFKQKRIIFLVLGLVITLLVDTSIIKVMI